MKVFSMSQRIYYKDLESDAESIIKKVVLRQEKGLIK